jgi:predicted DNA-binding transcriptional regulator AlpA
MAYPHPPPPPPCNSSADALIPLKRIARSLGLDPSTIAKMATRGDFPPPFDLGIRKKVWRLSALEAWWRTRLGGIDGEPFPLAAADNGNDGH